MESFKALIMELYDRRGKEQWHFDVRPQDEWPWYPIQTDFDEGDDTRRDPFSGQRESCHWMTCKGILKHAGRLQEAGFGLLSTDIDKNKLSMERLLARGNMRLHQAGIEVGYEKAQRDAAALQCKPGAVRKLTAAVEATQTVSFLGMQQKSNYARRPLAGFREAEERAVVDTTLDAYAGQALVWAERECERMSLGQQPAKNYTPNVRMFSLSHKAWISADIRTLSECNWADQAIDSVILPTGARDLLTAVLSADLSTVPPDILPGKHGGLVVLAAGPSGCGKTVTAEAASEFLKRPLYFVGSDDLTGDVEVIEGKLKQIFRRAAAWGCILLFDEADVFMHKRGTDVQQNMLVAAFLRLMDNFKGILFLSTNLEEAIDPAFASRITLCIRYPQLDEGSRLTLWRDKLSRAGLTFAGALEPIAKAHVMNGREIRNAVRLLSVLYKDADELTADQINNVCMYRVGALGTRKEGV
jgi:hypothetical protein